ncbi:condensation domain-containing protein [Streptomyces sp. NPDC054847]
MTTDHSSPMSRKSPDKPMAVVLDPGKPPYDTPPVLELRGPLDTGRIEAALERIAARRPDTPPWQHRLQYLGPGLHALSITPQTPGASGDFPVGLLADLLTDASTGRAPLRSVAAAPLQRDLLADADAHPGTDRHVEQLTWTWHGPLDPDLFAAAWQSLFERDSVLRAAFDDGPEPRIVLHEQVTPDIVRLPHTHDWNLLVARDRRRGLDPRRPGPLRITVLDGGPAASDPPPPVRLLLTYHQALLDEWSVRLLLREFCRAYLAGGRLPGGERRPDLGDHAAWLARQDTTAAKEFFARAAPPPEAAHWPEPAGPATPAAGPAGTGRARLRLTPARTTLLREWAACWGSTESGALQAVWALLLYAATGSARPEPVRFSVTVSGRGILLEGVERLPGALRNPLPVTVTVDPRSSVPHLLAQLRDRVLDMAAYEWVSAGQIRAWTDAPARATAHPGSLVVFDAGRPSLDPPAAELAARSVRVGPPEPQGARTAFPLTLAAHHDSDGALVVTATYDRALLTGITDVLGRAAHLLHDLPRVGDESLTIADVLALPAGTGPHTGTAALTLEPPTGPATDDETPGAPALTVLRPARDAGAGTVCLLAAHGTPRSCYELLARSYTGPEALVLLDPVPDDPHARYRALRPLTDAGGPLVLGGFSGHGPAAHDIVRLVAADGGRPPLVVLTGPATAAGDLARLLEAVAGRAG